MAHGLQVEALQDFECLGKQRSLAPWSAAIQVVAMIIDGYRRLDADLVFGQVGHGQKASLGLIERDDLLGQFPLVDEIPSRH